MIDFVPPRDASLPELLAHRARHASDGRLVLDAGGGALVLIALLVWRPPGWPILASAALCFAAFGAWGIADRELGERPPGAHDALTRLLRAARIAAGAIGGLGAVGLILTLMGLALGTWIS